MRALIASAFFAFALATPALADKRVALVIGNAGYENVSRLANPANDADAITDTLKKAGFDVVESRRDLKINETRRVLRDFSDKARDADVAVIYYAGHGIEVDGTNYLVPVDAALERDADVFDEAIALDRILITIEPARKLRLVILDACRDNPFARKMKRTLATRAIGRGFAKVEPNSPNTLIAFAAKAGSTASDGDAKNSPFTAALVKHIATPGLDLRKAFGFVRDEVLKQTSNKQEPFVYGSLGGNDVSLVPAPAVITTPAPAAAVNNEIRRDYELASQVGSIDAFDTFIATYPSGFYTELAKAQRRKLIAESARLEATEKARLAAEEKARLAGENAKKKEQDEAAARAKAAEQARLAAEKAKRDEEAKVAAAEKAKTEAQAKLAEQERLAAEKAKRDEEARLAAAEKAKAEAQAKLAEQQRLAAERLKQAEEKAAAAKAAADKIAADKAAAEAAAAKAAADKIATEKALADKAAAEPAPEKPAGDTKLAALAPPANPDPQPKAESINRQLQSELRRVGCYTGTVNDDWGSTAQRSLEQFNKRASLKLNIKLASIDALDAVKGKTSRVCPLICQHGYKAEGEKCVEIVCKAGFEVGDNNTCERIPPKNPPPAATAKRDEAPKREETPAAKREEPKQQKQAAPTGQRIICTQAGCREIAKNCRLERLVQGNTSQDRMNSLSGVREVCN